MTEVLILVFALAAAFFVIYQGGKWRQRARALEQENRRNRKAHEIQNDVMLDPAFRERVRRRFDRP